MRPCDLFLQQRFALLGENGYKADLATVEYTSNGWPVFYHYTREDHLYQIFESGGLFARLPVVGAEHLPDLNGSYLIEGLLQPLPEWMMNNPYFGDFCIQMLREYVGDLLLQIILPDDFPGLYVAEMAHNFDCQYQYRFGHSALNLGYDCRTGQEVVLAEANSYIPLHQYHGGHILPNVKATRHGEGLVIPSQYIHICDLQPLRQV
jgi:hypothetical protein